MAKPLVLRHVGVDLPFQLEKIDRGKLYGSVDTLALDEQGRPCELATLLTDGRTLVGKGGRAVAFLTPDGQWLDRKELRAVDLDGQPIPPVGSSFAEPVEVARQATAEDYLSHHIKAVYRLVTAAAEDAAVQALVGELRAGAIYTFPFSWRGGVTADVGFLLAGADGNLFLALGQPTRLHFVGLADPTGSYALEEEVAPDGEEADELDFGML